VAVALASAEGGLLLGLVSTTVKPTVFITGISFGVYVLARLVGPLLARRRRTRLAGVLA
jgi:hypothetical protein